MALGPMARTGGEERGKRTQKARRGEKMLDSGVRIWFIVYMHMLIYTYDALEGVERMTSAEIKEYGLSIGFDRVGIAPVERLAGFAEEVLSRGEAYKVFRKMLTKPVEETMPGARSVIVMVWDYFSHGFPEALTRMIGKVYLARCYTPPAGTVEHARLQLMRDFLTGAGCRAEFGGLNVPARWAAAQAGVATIGRNTFAYAEDAGSYVVIQTILVDAELEYDQPTVENRCPPNCRACMDACPTGALYAPFKLDPARCVAFNHWMTQDRGEAKRSFISHELREGMGERIHGCDACQDACPRNRKKLRQEKPADRYLEAVGEEITLPAILNMTDDYYARRIRPIMYNYIGDKRYFMRNAAIAMGNARDAGYVEDLARALENPDDMVREYAAWALGKIGDAAAREVLAGRMPAERAENVRQAMTQALEQV